MTQNRRSPWKYTAKKVKRKKELKRVRSVKSVAQLFFSLSCACLFVCLPLPNLVVISLMNFTSVSKLLQQQSKTNKTGSQFQSRHYTRLTSPGCCLPIQFNSPKWSLTSKDFCATAHQQVAINLAPSFFVL